jgi:hypothetical protein
VVRALALALAACSSSASKPEKEDHTVEHPVARDAGAATADAASAGGGALQIRVEWHDVPALARASPGRTRCGTARAGAVAPTTMWGIPEVFVIVDAPGAAAPPPSSQLVLEHCALSPRAVVAGAQLEVVSHADAPVQLALARRGELHDPASLAAGSVRAIELPVAGHAVMIPLESGGLYELTGAETDTAWVVGAAGSFVAVTGANGEAVLGDIPSGHHSVTAWLPPRAGQPGRVGKAEATVIAGTVVEVTVDLAR